MGGGPYYAQLGGSRILDTDRVDQSGSDDGDVAGWGKSDVAIVAVCIHSGGKETEAAQYKLRWRNETDNPGGSFSDLDSTGECKFGDATALSNGTALTEANRRTSTQGDDWQNGEEVEGVKLSDSIDLADDYESEIQFAVSLADGDDGDQYTFDLYDDTRGAQVGILGAQITLAAGAQTYYQNTGQASMSITGGVLRKTSKNMGGYSMSMAGGAVGVLVAQQAVGGYSLTSAGALGAIPTFVQSVGQYSMTVAGSLLKKISISVGGYSLTSTGVLDAGKWVAKAVGGGSVAIVGILSTVFIAGQSAGGYLMSIVGNLAKQYIPGTGEVWHFTGKLLRGILRKILQALMRSGRV